MRRFCANLTARRDMTRARPGSCPDALPRGLAVEPRGELRAALLVAVEERAVGEAAVEAERRAGVEAVDHLGRNLVAVGGVVDAEAGAREAPRPALQSVAEAPAE